MIRCFDFESIKSFLREDEIANLNILGAIDNIKGDIFGNPKDALEIYVDNLEAPTGVVVREHEYWHYVYTRSDAFIKKAKEELFDCYDEYGIDASDERVFELLSENREIEWEEPCELLYIDPETFKLNEPALVLGSATLNDASEINHHYTYKDEHSLKFIEECINSRATSVYRINGEAIGWVLIHRDDSVGIMYIKEEHRKKGIAYELSMDIIKKVIENGKIPFIHIGLKNKASFKLAEKCGYQKKKTIYWFGIKNETKPHL